MLKTLFATTAFASSLALASFAQTATEPMAPATEAPAEVTPMAPAADTATDVEPIVPGAAETDSAMETPDADGSMMGDMADGPMLSPVVVGDISTDDLIGAQIQTLDMENIAEVDDVLLGPDGTAESVVATFGGFLGFGSNTVLLTMDEVEVMQDEAGSYVVQTTLTPEALEGRPDYEAAN